MTFSVVQRSDRRDKEKATSVYIRCKGKWKHKKVPFNVVAKEKLKRSHKTKSSVGQGC